MRRRLRAEFSKTDVNVKVREERRREAAIPNTTLFVARASIPHHPHAGPGACLCDPLAG